MLALLDYFYNWLLFQMGFQNHIGLLGQLWDAGLFFVFVLIMLAIVIASIQTFLEYRKERKNKEA